MSTYYPFIDGMLGSTWCGRIGRVPYYWEYGQSHNRKPNSMYDVLVRRVLVARMRSKHTSNNWNEPGRIEEWNFFVIEIPSWWSNRIYVYGWLEMEWPKSYSIETFRNPKLRTSHTFKHRSNEDLSSRISYRRRGQSLASYMSHGSRFIGQPNRWIWLSISDANARDRWKTRNSKCRTLKISTNVSHLFNRILGNSFHQINRSGAGKVWLTG